jgi:hypothetical protein
MIFVRAAVCEKVSLFPNRTRLINPDPPCPTLVRHAKESGQSETASS